MGAVVIGGADAGVAGGQLLTDLGPDLRRALGGGLEVTGRRRRRRPASGCGAGSQGAEGRLGGCDRSSDAGRLRAGQLTWHVLKMTLTRGLPTGLEVTTGGGWEASCGQSRADRQFSFQIPSSNSQACL